MDIIEKNAKTNIWSKQSIFPTHHHYYTDSTDLPAPLKCTKTRDLKTFEANGGKDQWLNETRANDLSCGGTIT